MIKLVQEKMYRQKDKKMWQNVHCKSEQWAVGVGVRYLVPHLLALSNIPVGAAPCWDQLVSAGQPSGFLLLGTDHCSLAGPQRYWLVPLRGAEETHPYTSDSFSKRKTPVVGGSRTPGDTAHLLPAWGTGVWRRWQKGGRVSALVFRPEDATTDLRFSPPSGGSVYSVAKEPLGDFSPLPSTSRSWQGVLETDSFSGKGKSSSDKTDLQHVTGQVPRISSAPPGSQTCLFLPQAGGQGEWTHLPLEDRPQMVGAVRSSSQNMNPALKGGKEGWALRCGSRCQLWESGSWCQ